MIKLLVLTALCVAAWMLWRRGGRGRGDGAATDTPTPAPQTLERCPECGVYYLTGAAEPCDRAECPRRHTS